MCIYIYDSKSVNWVISQLYPTPCPWTVACQAPLSMGFSSRQEYWNGLPFPSPGDLPDPRIKPWSPVLQADSLLSEPPGKPYIYILYIIYIYNDIVKLKGWGKLYHANIKQWEVGVIVLISDRVNFRTKNYQRSRRSLYNNTKISPLRKTWQS